MARGTLTFIPQQLMFLINIKKSYLKPTLILEFLEAIVDSGENDFELSQRETPQSTESEFQNTEFPW